MDSRLLKDAIQGAQVRLPGRPVSRQKRILTLLAAGDQAGVAELFDVVREGGRGNRQLRFQQATRHFVAGGGDAPEDLEARGVGQRLRDLLCLSLGHQ
jgi:hypothetical protein